MHIGAEKRSAGLRTRQPFRCNPHRGSKSLICILQAWVYCTTLQRKKAAAKAWVEHDRAAGLLEMAFGAWQVLAMLRPAAADAHAGQRLRRDA